MLLHPACVVWSTWGSMMLWWRTTAPATGLGAAAASAAARAPEAGGSAAATAALGAAAFEAATGTPAAAGAAKGLDALGATAAATARFMAGAATAARAGQRLGASLGTAAARLVTGTGAAASAGQRLGAALGTAPARLVAGAAGASGGESLRASLGAAGAAELGTAALRAAAQLAVLLMKRLVLEGDAAAMLGMEAHLLELGTAGVRLPAILAEQHRVDDDAAGIPVIAAPYRRPDEEGRPPAPDRARRPPDRIPEERRGDVDGGPIADAEDNDRVVDRHVIDLRLHRLDVVDDLGCRPRVPGRRRLLDDLHVLVGFQIAGRFRPGAQDLDRLGDIVGLRQKRLAELLRPIELVAHEEQHIGN